MNQLYKVLAISKQAVNQHSHARQQLEQKIDLLLDQANHLRAEHPGCGVEKMYYTLQPAFMGRDKFIELFMDLGFKIRRKRNYQRTTYSTDHYYPNLIQGRIIDSPSDVWQSDITYIRVMERFYYAVFIIDVYTKKIVGYSVSKSLRAEANVRALSMALKNHAPPLIHHSDRGSQYIYHKYIDLLKKKKCQISMALTAQDNAYAERINQTIKDEYLSHWSIESFEKLKSKTNKAVQHYNNYRIHKHLGRMTPTMFEEHWKSLSKDMKTRIIIFDNK
jgi:putative transposase